MSGNVPFVDQPVSFTDLVSLFYNPCFKGFKTLTEVKFTRTTFVLYSTGRLYSGYQVQSFHSFDSEALNNVKCPTQI